MLWFQPMPWGRWALVLLIAVGALYVELKPEATVDSPFATVTINPGDVIDQNNTELRRTPVGLLETAELGEVANERIEPGSPVMASSAGDQADTVPTGWWVIGVKLPDGADVGDEPGSDDPFAAADGGGAVPPERSAEVAVAASDGRLAVLISTG
jgi:hypothetical protein